MRMVGTVALDPGRVPGAGAVTLTCELCAAAAQATGRLRHGARVVARGVVTVVRARGPVVAALVTALRAWSTSWAAAVASPSAHVSRLPSARSSARSSARVGQVHRELVLPADASAPGMARAFLRGAAAQWGVDDDLAQDAAIVITELVANAVDHARTESTLSLGVTADGLCVSVRDARPEPVPRLAPIDPTAPRGRGLQMVDALTTAWGVTTHAGGKTVWAVLGSVRD
jgi:anti-sigma regulatory factor (Ser/Thr protein kinase)